MCFYWDWIFLLELAYKNGHKKKQENVFVRSKKNWGQVVIEMCWDSISKRYCK
jgi:hypothetical protein